ncbi:MAG: LysM peptidoglycan-binding domain-containing protein [Chloroflexi bacterium]|nr:LysM peptidoglycan-binding domain-containing protein [Chloroflexota bacterium]
MRHTSPRPSRRRLSNLHEQRSPLSRATSAAGRGLQAIVGTGAVLFESVAPALNTLIESRPRYFFHATAVGVAAIVLSVVVLQPRPEAVPASAMRQATMSMEAVDSSEQVASAATSAPEPAPASAATAPSAPEAAAALKPQRHTVQEGETLRMLSAKYGVSTQTIMAANGISDPDLIRVGQELVILPTSGVLYTVKSGETLRQVAERYAVPLAEIVTANGLGANPDLLVVGTEVVVPGANPLVQAPAPATVAVADGEQRAAQIAPPVPIVDSPARRQVPSSRTYEVKNGDTLVSIASLFGVDVATILSSNGLSNPDSIKPGVELRILPTRGLEYEVQPGEKLSDIAWKYQVDLGLLLDYNDLDNADVIRVGTKLVLPNGRLRAEAVAAPPAPVVEAPAPRPATSAGTQGGPAVVAQPAPPAPKPAPKPQTVPAPAPAAPVPAPAPAPVAGGRGGQAVVAAAMQFKGYPYVWGGTSPSGFDCSGFVYYVSKISGNPVGRGLWQQYNGGVQIPRDELLPGDAVFFANTYMPGLSHNGIYIGNGQFINAADESTGVTVSNMNSQYWASRYVGATRLWS